MAFKHQYPDQESIPKGLQEHFAKGEDGIYRPVLEDESRSEGFRIENVQGLSTALQSERESVKNLREGMKKYDAIKDLDVDGNAIKTALEENKSLKGSQSEQAQQLQTTISSMNESRGKDIKEAVEPVAAQRDKAVKALKKTMISKDLTFEIEEAGGSPELLVPVLTAQIDTELDWDNQDGPVKVFIKGTNGNARLRGDGEHMSIAELVGETKANPKYERAFEANRQAGPGGQPPRNRPSGGAKLTKEQALALSDEEFTKAVAERRI